VIGVIIEKTDRNYSAYAPDIPSGCVVATGSTLEEVQREMLQALRFHLEDEPGAGDVSIYVKALKVYVGDVLACEWV
jgi:predicted RNase H-like HicB family nuclease